MTAQPSLFAIASRYVVEVWNRRIDYAVVIDQATGQAVATGTAAACEEMAASLRGRGETLPVTKKCNNPQCQRTTPGNVDYCCRPCRLAHDGGYSVTGLHSPRCDEDARRERGTGGGGQGGRG